MFGSIGTTELILILAIVLLIFGVGKLPEVFKALGSGVREFRDAAGDVPDGDDDATDAAPAATSDTTSDAS
jgi:sec-independent protein translocase protein TatA